MSAHEQVLNAMRSGEWLRTQWIARVAFDLGDSPGPHANEYAATRHALRALEARGVVERRPATELRSGEIAGARVAFEIPREEWRRADRT